MPVYTIQSLELIITQTQRTYYKNQQFNEVKQCKNNNWIKKGSCEPTLNITEHSFDKNCEISPNDTNFDEDKAIAIKCTKHLRKSAIFLYLQNRVSTTLKFFIIEYQSNICLEINLFVFIENSSFCGTLFREGLSALLDFSSSSVWFLNQKINTVCQTSRIFLKTSVNIWFWTTFQ